MTNHNYRFLIEQAIQACRQKNASSFIALFSNDGEIQLNNQTKINHSEIEEVTDNYFSALKFIKINVHDIAINEQEYQALIEWTWSDYNLTTNTNKTHRNLIVLEFKDNLIYRWREYS